VSEAAKEQVVVREKGTVKWFNAAKGFGFICFPGNRDGIFCHFSNINLEGYKTLEQDEEVEFEIAESTRSGQLQAVNVTPKRK
jgi:cold shock protein